MSTRNVTGKIKQLHDLPTLPTILTQCNAMLKNPDVGSRELAEVIKSDQSIASKVLKMVNSAFYGLSSKVGTISQAIVILGFNTVRNILLSVSVFELIPQTEDFEGFQISRFWEHSIGCAVISKLISQRLGVSDPEEIFTAGLLHDLGKVVIAKLFREEFLSILKLAQREKVLWLDAEQVILGMPHTQLGEMVAKQWHLPAPIADAIALHHDPGEASDNSKLVSIVHVADILTRGLQIGCGGDKVIPEINNAAWDTLGTSMENIERWIDELDDALEKAGIFLSLVRH